MAWKPDYATLADLKSYLNDSVTANEAAISLAITAASRSVDADCNRQFGKVASAEERFYTARWDYYRHVWVVDIDDLDDITGLVVEVGGNAVTAYTLEPVNAVLKGMVWTRLVVDSDSTVQPTGVPNEASITAKWGWTTFPTVVKQATWLQASRFVTRRDSPYGIAGSPDQGSELRLLSRVDPDVAVMLREYRRMRVVG